jgi:hypothetical protein
MSLCVVIFLAEILGSPLQNEASNVWYVVTEYGTLEALQRKAQSIHLFHLHSVMIHATTFDVIGIFLSIYVSCDRDQAATASDLDRDQTRVHGF